MKQRRPALILMLLIALLLFPARLSTAHAQAALPVVHAVLFYSPSCPHCHYVITETLPPLFEKYGDQFQIIGIDVTAGDGQTLFQAALQKFNVKEGGVPFLVIGNTFLIGSGDIPEQLPGLIDTYLAAGGVDWPDIPGLSDALAQASETTSAETADLPSTVAPSSSAAPAEVPDVAARDGERPGWQTNFASDVRGNMLSTLLLAAMLGALAWVIVLFLRGDHFPAKNNWDWLIPVLCVLGLGVAGYLAYVESAQVSAVCGPVGDCNTVQKSEYARLFGVLPIGVLGVMGYLFIAGGWLVRRLNRGRLADLAAVALLAMTTFGTLFSIYLTFLEPFVIGATCAWCLTSAMVMTILMMISAQPGRLAALRLFHPPFA